MDAICAVQITVDYDPEPFLVTFEAATSTHTNAHLHVTGGGQAAAERDGLWRRPESDFTLTARPGPI